MIRREGTKIFEQIASFVCHQISERTLTVGGQLLPLCARCTGIYSGFLIGLIYQIMGKRKVNRLPILAVSVVSAILILSLIIEGFGEKLHLWQLSNQERMLMGLYCGSSISVILFPLLNYFLKKEPAFSSSLGLKHYIGLLVLISIFFSLHYIPGTFLIFSFVSIAGILAVYFIANVTFAGMVLNWKKKTVSFGNIMLLSGFVLVLFVGEIILLNNRIHF